MAMVSIKCPNCGGSLELDDAKEFGFCIFCGTQVRVQEEKTRIEVSGSVTFDESEKYKNYLNLATQAYDVGNMEEAYNYYTRALEIRQSDYLPVFRKALCAGYLSSDSGLRIEEVVSGISRAFDMVADDVQKRTMSAEIVHYVVSDKLHLSSEFYSSDDCARYVKSVYNKVSLLNRLYPFVNKDDMENTISFIDVEQSYCKLLTQKSMRFKAGTTVKKGKTETVFGTYPVPQNILNEVADISRRFTEEYNQFIRPRIQKVEADILATKAQIKTLPQLLQILYTICSGWVALLGLLLAAPTVFVGSAIVWGVQLVCLIAVKVLDKDKTAATLYKALKTQKKELAGLKKKLRK